MTFHNYFVAFSFTPHVRGCFTPSIYPVNLQPCRAHIRPTWMQLQTPSPRHFINLTNGIEALPQIASLTSKDQVRFTRIQSSHCESGAYDKLLSSLDTELVFSLACGRDCYIYDFGSRNRARGVPRALFLGVEFIKWSLAYLWFSPDNSRVPNRVLVRGKNTVPFWQDEIMAYKISKDTKKKLRYFTPFVREMGVDAVKLHGVYGRVSDIDGCKDIHVKMVREWLENEQEEKDMLDFESWLERFRFAEYDSSGTPEDLVRTQEWMHQG